MILKPSHVYSSSNSLLTGFALFFCFFIGFAIKAGFVPFHTWLPYAHPAAPSHVSGVMSGVIIKIGIYGIMRMLLLIKTDYLVNRLYYFIYFHYYRDLWSDACHHSAQPEKIAGLS